ncbi:hypothetical protein P280DRAFT_476514 [Massarina eburnea CBS 473.64]|uniref:Uncharacterized protein n=1 Tax=Massarina eburnea CBS 473.64 TaxID=1395130 RepID=A0A6A6S9Q0_9PLEO|nr:hypothetical protein P280DRAFT_476514 [Massarina eburnea CBS 473.64]
MPATNTAKSTQAKAVESKDSTDNSIDPVRSRILNELRTHFSSYPEDFLLKTAKNFAFLARHYAGSGIAPARVSVPLIDISTNGEVVAHRMALVVHEGAGKTRVLFQHRSPLEHMSCLVYCMADLAEMAISSVLDDEKERAVYDVGSEDDC